MRGRIGSQFVGNIIEPNRDKTKDTIIIEKELLQPLPSTV
jgi:hypothetical protein